MRLAGMIAEALAGVSTPMLKPRNAQKFAPCANLNDSGSTLCRPKYSRAKTTMVTRTVHSHPTIKHTSYHRLLAAIRTFRSTTSANCRSQYNKEGSGLVLLRKEL